MTETTTEPPKADIKAFWRSNKWFRVCTWIAVAILIFSIGASGNTTETETITVTETETVEIKDTKEIERLEAKLEVCETELEKTWKSLKRRNDMFVGVFDELSQNILGADFAGITQRIEADNVLVASNFASSERCTDLTSVGFGG